MNSMNLIKAIIFSFGVWLGATAFFILFGSRVLVPVSDIHFPLVLAALEIGTAALLFLAMKIYTKWDGSEHALITFGTAGTAVGLLLDTFSVWNHELVFPGFTNGQFHSFSVWMTLAYFLYIAIPACSYLRSIRPQKKSPINN